MLGYVITDRNELKVREADIYNGYYCGICKSIGRRIGQLPRLSLSYDAVFLTIILASLIEKKENLVFQHCIVHPIMKKPVVLDEEAVDYGADVMVILAYHKFLDDWKDERSLKGLSGMVAFHHAYKKLRKMHPEICIKVEKQLDNLSNLENEKSNSIDRTCDAFADIMKVLFTGFNDNINPTTLRIMGEIGKYLGKWIYLIDATDDYVEDLEKDNYNPLIYRYNRENSKLVMEKVGPLLYHYLAEISKACDLLNIGRNKGIVENIVYMGLRMRTDEVLTKGKLENE